MATVTADTVLLTASSAVQLTARRSPATRDGVVTIRFDTSSMRRAGVVLMTATNPT